MDVRLVSVCILHSESTPKPLSAGVFLRAGDVIHPVLWLVKGRDSQTTRTIVQICYERCIATLFCQNNTEVCHFNKKVCYFDVN